MNTVSRDNFGFLIAYIIPGFVVVAVLCGRSSNLREAFGLFATNAPTVGGFLYATLASVTAGLILGVIRWLILDRVHQVTGVTLPHWDFSASDTKREVFEYLVEMHYRYYEFYGHMFFAVLISLSNVRQMASLLAISGSATTCFILLLAVLFFFASRDALRKYYIRTQAVLTAG